MSEKIECSELFCSVLGLFAIILGLANIMVWVGLYQNIEIGILSIGGEDFFRWAWGSCIVITGGILMLTGAKKITTLHQFVKVLCGAGLIWIVGGTDLFAIICGNIPAGEDSLAYFNSFSGFIEAFAPPYSPAIILLPFTFVMIYLAYRKTGYESAHTT